MFPNFAELAAKLDNGFRFICAQLVELVKGQAESNSQVQRITNAFTAEYGIFIEDRERGVTTRNVLQPPMVWEQTVTAQTVIETRHPQGRRLIYGGFYANLGNDAFRVRLICPGGESPEHTVPPGTTIPISSVVQQVVILPVAGRPANFQIYGR